MSLDKPDQLREPACIHSDGQEPASACLVCSQGPELQEWKNRWWKWIRTNPSSFEARWMLDRYPTEANDPHRDEPFH